MTLGTYASGRYHKSWITQRMLNNAPEWTHMRTCPVSVANQVLNPAGVMIEQTVQELLEERNNGFLSLCRPGLMSHVYEVELPYGFIFQEEEQGDGSVLYTTPTVYAEINGAEEQITVAENNDIRTLYYTALPTRIEYGDQQIIWKDVVPTTTASQIIDLEPDEMVIEGHLYVTIRSNLIWQREFKRRLYFSKITITGITRKGTEQTEVLPLRLDGTYQTVNQWQSVSEIYISHMAEDAEITVSALPFAEDPVVDNMNLAVPVEGGDRVQYVQVEDYAFGSVLEGVSYTNDDPDIIRLGITDMRTDYQMELQDENGTSVSLNGFTLEPFSPLLYAIDDYNFYVYDRRLPYPDVSGMKDETADCRIELTLPDHDWVYMRGETATVTTRTVDVLAVPTVFRWSVTVPDGTTYRVASDGTYYDEDTDSWITNDLSDQNKWEEQIMEFAIDQTGEYIVEFDATYRDPDGEVVDRNAKLLLYVPAIQPEVQIALPESLRGCRQLAIDSDNRLWLYNGTTIYLVDRFYDYFMVDYAYKKIYMREQYNEVRVVP